ncbi:hypothetical protein [Aquabacterium humicola]|uniref:hypothetical protein n=1 Tax=Aquabacterium humicola TaxID=3237377 RepID=UPI0025430301|nr:hypothetical protein [Rubrivivax pictus]
MKRAGLIRPQVPPEAWRLVMRFGFYGPLVGGAPYNWMLFPLPFSYLLGIGPALLCGVGFALWWFGPAQRSLGAGWRALAGAAIAAVACALWALVTSSWDGRADDLSWWLAVLCLHGVPAGALIGAGGVKIDRDALGARPAAFARAAARRAQASRASAGVPAAAPDRRDNAASISAISASSS